VPQKSWDAPCSGVRQNPLDMDTVTRAAYSRAPSRPHAPFSLPFEPWAFAALRNDPRFIVLT
jgi:hypothetical protein